MCKIRVRKAALYFAYVIPAKAGIQAFAQAAEALAEAGRPLTPLLKLRRTGRLAGQAKLLAYTFEIVLCICNE
jgi:hypothetical protein